MLCVETELFVHRALKHSSNVDCSHWWDTFMAFIFLIFFHTEIVKEQLPRRWLTVSLSFLHSAHQLDLIQFLFFLLSQVKILATGAHNIKFLVFNGLSKISSYHSLSQFVLLNILLHILTLQLKLHLLCSKTTLTHHLFIL